MKSKLDEIEDAFLFADAGMEYDGESCVIIERATGKVYYRSETADIDELPDDADDDEKYVTLPGKRDLDLGTRLVFRFIRERLPEHYDKVDGIFSRKGAYRRYKDWLDDIGKLDEWHDYENAAQSEALRVWCEEEGINLDD